MSKGNLASGSKMNSISKSLGEFYSLGIEYSTFTNRTKKPKFDTADDQKFETITFKNTDEASAFLRGIIDTVGKINSHEIVIMTNSIPSNECLYIALNKLKVRAISLSDCVRVVDINVFDLLGYLYAPMVFPTSTENYQTATKILYGRPEPRIIHVCIKDDGVMPRKERPSDEGADVIITSLIETKGLMYKYETNIICEPPLGYYFMLYGRSSLGTRGYYQPPGVIDSSYRDTLKVVLFKSDPTVPDLTLPMKTSQLVLCKSNHFTLKHVTEMDLSVTSRGKNGFGSSGVI